MIKELLDRIDELETKLQNPEYRKVQEFQIQKNKKRKKQLDDYRIISHFLQNEYSIYGISNITIWRLLKIKHQDSSMYEKIRRGEIKVKTAYEKLFVPAPQSENIQNLDFEKIDLEKTTVFLNNLADSLDDFKNTLKKQPSEKNIKDMDATLFRLRKILNKIFTYYENSEEDI